MTSPHHDLSHIETNNIITFTKNGHGSFKLSKEGPPQFQKGSKEALNRTNLQQNLEKQERNKNFYPRSQGPLNYIDYLL